MIKNITKIKMTFIATIIFISIIHAGNPAEKDTSNNPGRFKNFLQWTQNNKGVIGVNALSVTAFVLESYYFGPKLTIIRNQLNNVKTNRTIELYGLMAVKYSCRTIVFGSVPAVLYLIVKDIIKSNG